MRKIVHDIKSQIEATDDVQESEELKELELNVLRYVSGGCIHHVGKHMKLSVERKLLRKLHHAEVYYRAQWIFNSLRQPEGFITENSDEPEMLLEIIRRQGYKRCLTFISDDVLKFFKMLYLKLKCTQTF